MKYYLKEQEPNGSYVDAEGVRYALYTCRRHADERGVNVGWEAFESMEACLAAWGLRYEPLPEQEPEK